LVEHTGARDPRGKEQSKTASDYAGLAQLARQLGNDIRPDAHDPFVNAINEAVVYLNLAAVKLKAVAEYKAEKEKVHAATE
jgi:hypothetical protein